MAVSIRRDYIDVDDLQIHFRSLGDKTLPTVLFLHQTPSSSAMYERLMTGMAGRFQVLAPDTPGFGNSDPVREELSIARLADIMLKMLDRMGIADCFVFGHHTGASIAVQLASQAPGRVQAMALSGPTLLTEEQQRSLPEAASPFPVATNGGHLQSMWQRLRVKDPAAAPALSQRELLSAFACGDAYQASYRAVCAQDFSNLLQDIHCPVLVFAGDADPLKGAVSPTIEKLSKGRELTLPEGAGTYICEQQAEFLADKLAAFFDDAA